MPATGRFDTVIMMGNNLGLLGSYTGARRILRRLSRVLPVGGRIIGETLDPYQTAEPAHLAYHARNRARGRMPGQVRMRIRYKSYRTPWFDYLFVSMPELQEILDGTGRCVADTVHSTGANYVAVLEWTGRVA